MCGASVLVRWNIAVCCSERKPTPAIWDVAGFCVKVCNRYECAHCCVMPVTFAGVYPASVNLGRGLGLACAAFSPASVR
jgi:hypothetical protein